MSMNNEEIKDFIAKNRWTFAHTYAHFAPHEYILRPNVQENFDDFIETIRKLGKKAKFFSREYIYLDFGDYYYWVMNSNTEKDFIINRASKSVYELRDINGKLYMFMKR